MHNADAVTNLEVPGHFGAEDPMDCRVVEWIDREHVRVSGTGLTRFETDIRLFFSLLSKLNINRLGK